MTNENDLLDENGKVMLKESERQKAICMTRIMGYLAELDLFNIGKKQEQKDRKLFTEPPQRTLETERVRFTT